MNINKNEVASEQKLVETIVWSTNEFRLSQFVEMYELPQLVRVEIGFYGENERSTLSGGQLLTLHSLHQTPKVMCEVSTDNVVVLPYLCPLKGEVYPLPRDCAHSELSVDVLAATYKDSVKYLRVILSPDQSSSNNNGSCEINDILKVKSISKQGVHCTNITNKGKLFIPFRSPALFAPLLDHHQYTLAEIKEKFGFPAKVRFPETRTERQLRHKNKDSSMAISSLGTVNVLGDYEETVVVSTTISGSAKVCYQIPKDLEITIVVAEGFLSGDKNYQRIVRTLHHDFQRTNLDDFKGLNYSQHTAAVNEGIQNMALDVSTENAPDYIKSRLCELRAKAYLHDQTEEAPPIPGREPQSPPPRPAKRISSPNSPTSTSQPSTVPKSPPPFSAKTKTLPKLPTDKQPNPAKSKTLPNMFRFNPSKAFAMANTVKSMFNRQQSGEEKQRKRSPSQERTNEGEYTYIEPDEKDNIYEDPNYSSIDPNYVSANDHVYAEFDSRPRKPQIPLPAPPVPNKPADMSREKIYEALAVIPLDISGLSVREVSNVLKYLTMEEHVKLFATELVDGEMLQSMDRESLESLNLKAHQVKKLLKFIGGWRPHVG